MTETVDPGDSDAMVSLGKIADDAGDLELAESWYQKSADLGNQYAKDALAALNAP